MLRTIIYEDNTDLRAALAALIGGTPGYELVGAFGDCTEVVAQCRTLRPEVVLMDIDMPKMNGIEGTRLLKKALPEVEIVMLTVFDDDGRVFDAVMAGASGYLLKQTPPLSDIVGAAGGQSRRRAHDPRYCEKSTGLFATAKGQRQSARRALAPRIGRFESFGQRSKLQNGCR